MSDLETSAAILAFLLISFILVWMLGGGADLATAAATDSAPAPVEPPVAKRRTADPDEADVTVVKRVAAPTPVAAQPRPAPAPAPSPQQAAPAQRPVEPTPLQAPRAQPAPVAAQAAQPVQPAPAPAKNLGPLTLSKPSIAGTVAPGTPVTSANTAPAKPFSTAPVQLPVNVLRADARATLAPRVAASATAAPPKPTAPAPSPQPAPAAKPAQSAAAPSGPSPIQAPKVSATLPPGYQPPAPAAAPSKPAAATPDVVLAVRPDVKATLANASKTAAAMTATVAAAASAAINPTASGPASIKHPSPMPAAWYAKKIADTVPPAMQAVVFTHAKRAAALPRSIATKPLAPVNTNAAEPALLSVSRKSTRVIGADGDEVMRPDVQRTLAPRPASPSIWSSTPLRSANQQDIFVVDTPQSVKAERVPVRGETRLVGQDAAKTRVIVSTATPAKTGDKSTESEAAIRGLTMANVRFTLPPGALEDAT